MRRLSSARCNAYEGNRETGGWGLIGIRDLARHLDISIGTVSRALNGKADVNEETRRRVREAATRLGYTPNQSGRSLRRGKTDLVGVIVPVGSRNALINTVFLNVLDGLRRKLSENALDLAIFLQGQDKPAVGSLRRLIERGIVDGVIIADTLHVDPRIDYLIDKRRPFVAFGRSLSGGHHPWVDPDFESAVKGAMDHLFALGHSRIGLMLPDRETHFYHIVIDAYREALRGRGVEFQTGWLQRRPAGEFGGYDAGGALLAMRPAPSAVLVSEASQTLGLYRMLAEAGRQPGKDISLIGVLPEASASNLSPALTSFVTDWTAVGTRLGEALIAALADESEQARPAAIQAIIPTTFQAGSSVHAPSREDAAPARIGAGG